MAVLLNRFMSNLHSHKSVRLGAGLLALTLSFALTLYSLFIAAPAIFFVLSTYSFGLDISSMSWNMPDLIDGYKLISYWLIFMLIMIATWLTHRFFRVAFGKPFYIEKAGCRSYFILPLVKNTTLVYFMTLAIIYLASEYPTYDEELGESIVGHAIIEHEGQVVEINEAFIKKSPNTLYRYRISFLAAEISGNDKYDNIMIYLDIIPFLPNNFGVYSVNTMNLDEIHSFHSIGTHWRQVTIKENEDHYDMKIKTNNCIGCDYVNFIHVGIPKSIMTRL